MTKFWENDLDNFFADFSVEASLRRIATVGIGDGGHGYAVSDVLTLATPSGGIAATVQVTHVTAGVVDGILLLTDGAGYSTGIKTTTVTPAGGTGCTINVLTVDDSFNVIFHNEFEAASLFGLGVEQQDPYYDAKDSDITEIVHDTIIWIDSVRYKVTAKEPDGTGLSVLRISKD